jgi:hypothetical protein
LKKGFNLLMAIMIILILSGAAVLTIRYVSISAKHTADSYIKEQAEIFMQSAIEATLLKIEGYDRATNNNCLTNLTFNSADGKFKATINITKYYLYNGVDNDGVNHCGSLTKNIKTEESHGYIIIEAVVETTSNARVKDAHIRITRRTLQRP